MKTSKALKTWRQGDVLLIKRDESFLKGRTLKPVPLDRNRIVLAYGEVTGHAHAVTPEYAGEREKGRRGEGVKGATVTEALLQEAIESFPPSVDRIFDTKVDLRTFLSLPVADETTKNLRNIQTVLFETEQGDRFLISEKPFLLRHEEHEAIECDEGIYEVRRQRQVTADVMRLVAD